ncbi:flavoprotein [Streptomyces phaeochromogenes]
MEPDLADLRELTGHPVWHEYKLPVAADVLPPPDAILVAPATFNTLNKWAAGISDTLALCLVTEAIGLELPRFAQPYLNRAQAAHPALGRSVAFLRECEVNVLLGEGGFVPHVPKQDDVDAYLWDVALPT